MNLPTLAHELDRFQHFWTSLAPTRFRTSAIGDFIYRLEPQKTVLRPKHKGIGLTVLGLTHGNEVAGLAVQNDILSWLYAYPDLVQIPLVFALGNPAAALQNRRFIERDLNRSFGNKKRDSIEGQRAASLESVLSDSAFLLDIHQTTEPCATAFFIFPYTPATYQMARHTEARLPIVTHWGDPFSSEGRCSDEYTIANGGVGITLEIGQNGFGAYHIAAGFKAVLQCLNYATTQVRGEPALTLATSPELYTWDQIIPWPSHGDPKLEDGWYNFKEVKAGQRLGWIDEKELIAAASGCVLFPKYIRQGDVQRPTELIRIMRPITEAMLGQ